MRHSTLKDIPDLLEPRDKIKGIEAGSFLLKRQHVTNSKQLTTSVYPLPGAPGCGLVVYNPARRVAGLPGAPGCGSEVEFDYPACRVAGWRLLFERRCLVE